MKLLFLALSALIVGCSTYCKQQTPATAEMTRKEQAVDIARREIARRKITLPSGATMKIEEGTVNVEVGPDVRIYVVSFYAPDRRKSRPLYVVSVDRRNGRIEDFTDTSKLIPADSMRNQRR